MRYLIEVQLITVVPVVIEAETKKEALRAIESAREGDFLSGDPVALPPVIKRVKELGE